VSKLAIIIPIGPGHDVVAKHAALSVQQAAVYGSGPFAQVDLIPMDDRAGNGRSKARNAGLARAIESKQSDWIFWLDADDFLDTRALARMDSHLLDSYDCVWGRITTQAGYRQNQVTPLCYKDMIDNDPFYTLQMGFFCRASVAQQELWNEEMDCGEDYELFLRLWRSYRCTKVSWPLHLHRGGHHSTGPRSATGRQWVESVHAQRMAAQAAYTTQAVAQNA
jgi:hypothetical protein